MIAIVIMMLAVMSNCMNVVISDSSKKGEELKLDDEYDIEG